MSMSALASHRKALAAVPAAGLALVLLTGCGGGTSAAASSTDPSNSGSTNPAATGGGTPGGTRNFPGANGQIAEVTGKILQVQSTTTQTAVTYTGSTKLTQTVSAAKSDLAVGKCISVRSADTGTTTSTDNSVPVAASSVSISDPVDGSCTGGFGGGGGNLGAGFPGPGAGGQAPTGQPPADATGQSGAAGGNPAGRGMGPRGANGTITKIDGDTVTVESQQPQFNQNTSGSAASTTPTITTVTRTVTLSSATTYTKSASASSADLKVGKCVAALGTTGTDGTLTATSIALSPAQNGTCSAGFGGRGNGAAATTTS
jgi:hypothetical protein